MVIYVADLLYYLLKSAGKIADKSPFLPDKAQGNICVKLPY